MATIGRINQLHVLRGCDHGVYLDGEQLGDILLPRRYVSAECQVDSVVDVFIYRDSEDRLIATTEKPYAMVGEFAWLKVVSVTDVGAFLDWGLFKRFTAALRRTKIQTGSRSKGDGAGVS